MLRFKPKAILPFLLATLLAFPVLATSFKLQTNTVILEAGKQDVTFNVANTGQTPMLLLTTLEDLPGDEAFADRVLINPPVTRVNADSTQYVTFTLRPGDPIDREYLLKVGFEGVGQPRANNISIPVRQEIGFLITPDNWVPSGTPWEALTLTRKSDTLILHNPSRQVVRLIPQVTLVKTGKTVGFGQPYLRPGERVTLPDIPIGAESQGLVLSPLSRYGYKLKDVTFWGQ
ncbi:MULTISPECIES: fimbria/pilus chaperone family protein [Vibrio]|uniref:fimbria/pilus chaperone family protein n=1 Tax=Vibrio TaxID=662 RepID=UPI0006897265|nr:fimbria/pilus chaperone family protein [Vibrio pacinii]